MDIYIILYFKIVRLSTFSSKYYIIIKDLHKMSEFVETYGNKAKEENFKKCNKFVKNNKKMLKGNLGQKENL